MAPEPTDATEPATVARVVTTPPPSPPERPRTGVLSVFKTLIASGRRVATRRSIGVVILALVVAWLSMHLSPLEIPPAPGRDASRAANYCTELAAKAHSVAELYTFGAGLLVVLVLFVSTGVVASNRRESTDPETATDARLRLMGLMLVAATVALYCYRRADAAGQLSAATSIADVAKDGDPQVADGVPYATCARAYSEWEKSRADANNVMAGALQERTKVAQQQIDDLRSANLSALKNQTEAQSQLNQAKERLEAVNAAMKSIDTSKDKDAAAAVASAQAATSDVKNVIDKAQTANETATEHLQQPVQSKWIAMVGTDATLSGACGNLSHFLPSKATVYDDRNGNWITIIGPFETQSQALRAVNSARPKKSDAYLSKLNSTWVLAACATKG